MKIFKVILISLIILSCSDNENIVIEEDTLLSYISEKNIETGAVIACSSTGDNTDEIHTFFYTETGLENVRLYKTDNSDIEYKSDFSKYHQLNIQSTPFFDGFLRKYTTTSTQEHWIIITYELDGEIKISNPIRTKQFEKPTVWNDMVNINQDELLMPQFDWEANALGDNAIYFQIISKENNELVSGTYTNDNFFQFYDTTNVVLNITRGIPTLENGSSYNFILMDVSQDNWVNLISQNMFVTQ